jgi:hypothetical protein
MDLTPQQLAELGLTPEEGRDLVRLTTKLQQNHQVMVQNNNAAQRSFGQWLIDVLPVVGEAIGLAKEIVSNIKRSIQNAIGAMIDVFR